MDQEVTLTIESQIEIEKGIRKIYHGNISNYRGETIKRRN